MTIRRNVMKQFHREPNVDCVYQDCWVRRKQAAVLQIVHALSTIAFVLALVVLASHRLSAAMYEDVAAEFGSGYTINTPEELERVPKSVRVLTIRHRGPVAHVKKFLKLETLTSLTHLRVITDSRGWRLQGQPPPVPELLEVLPLCAGLETLVLDTDYVTGPESVARLAACTRLQTLILEVDQASDKAIAACRSLEALRNLGLGRMTGVRLGPEAPMFANRDRLSYIDEAAKAIAALGQLTQVRAMCLPIMHWPLPGVIKWAQSGRLDALESPYIDDSSIQVLSELMPSIRTLDLARNNRVSDLALGFLYQLPRLEELNLSECYGVGEYGLPALSRLTGLKLLDISYGLRDFTVDMDGSPVNTYPRLYERGEVYRTGRFNWDVADLDGEQNLSLLTQLTALRTLRLRGHCGLNVSSLRQIAKGLVQLEELDISGVGRETHRLGYKSSNALFSERDMDLSFLESLPKLRAVHLDRVVVGHDHSDQGRGAEIVAHAPVNDDVLRQLAKLVCLEVLSIRGAQAVSANALTALSKADKLRVLDLSDVSVSGSLSEALAQLKQVERLSLGSPRDSVGALSALAKLPALRELSIGARTTPEADVLASACALTQLRVLHIWYADMTETGAVTLASMENLTELRLSLNVGDAISFRLRIEAERPSLRVLGMEQKTR